MADQPTKAASPAARAKVPPRTVFVVFDRETARVLGVFRKKSETTAYRIIGRIVAYRRGSLFGSGRGAWQRARGVEGTRR